MPTLAFPTLNGVEPSWADVTVVANISSGPLVDLADISAIKWDRKVSVGYKKGLSGGRKMGRTVGEVEYTASMTIYKGAQQSFKEKLMLLAPVRGTQRLISLVTFDLLILQTPPGSINIHTTKIKGCRVTGDAFDMKEGSEAETVEFTLDPMEIVDIILGQEVALI